MYKMLLKNIGKKSDGFPSDFPAEKCRIFKMESGSVGRRKRNLFVIHALASQF